MEILPYTPDRSEEWDRFVAESRNGTFLFMRGYMDYHSDRFRDHSLMAVDDGGRIMALLPACADGDTLSSHAGLTYGGWVTPVSHSGPAVMLDIFECMLAYMKRAGFHHLVYKPVPPIYHRYPAEDDVYALFRNGAVMDGCMVSSTIPLGSPLLISGNNRRDAAKARRAGMEVSDLTDDSTLAEFWDILTCRLSEAHGVAPVHSLDEIILLHSRMPDNIRLLSVRASDGSMIGGMLLYLTPPVAHTQYIATTAEGRKTNCGALIIETLYHSLTGSDTTGITMPLADQMHYIDFGVSCEEWGRILNFGLSAQKERLGGRTTLYTRYRLNI